MTDTVLIIAGTIIFTWMGIELLRYKRQENELKNPLHICKTCGLRHRKNWRLEK